MKPNKQLQSLISLLDDPDFQVFDHVKNKIIDIGSDAVPALEKAWENFELGDTFRTRIENIIHIIQFEKTYNDLVEWKKSNSDDLLQAMYIISHYNYPDFDESITNIILDKIQKDIWIELNDELTALEKVYVMNHVFFDIHNFSPNTDDYHSPFNSYFSHVLESKKGNPISLAILYIIIAQRIGIPIYGVNLPNHFICAYVDKLHILTSEQEEQKILFYINPFSKGQVLSKREIQHFLKQLKLEENPIFFQPCSTIAIVERVVNNLIYSYQKEGKADKVKDFEKIQALLRG